RAGSVCHNPECGARGAALHTPPAPIIVTEAKRADLRHDRFEALGERSRPGHDPDGPRGSDRYPRAVERPEPALLDEHGKSRADAFATGATALELALQVAPFDLRQRLVEQAGIVAGIEHDLGAERRQRPTTRHLLLGNETTT